MFNNMKSKIREKTGTDIPKFVPNSKLSLSSSRQGSETSLNSLSCPITDINSNSSSIIDDIECLRHTSERERWTLSSKLAQSEETVRHLRDRVEVLMKRTEVTENGDGSVEETVQALREERALLERRLEEAHIHLADIKSSWSSKIASLETQLERLSRQAGEEGAERRKSDNLISQLEKKIKDFELTNESLNLKLERIKIERDSLATELKTLTAETCLYFCVVITVLAGFTFVVFIPRCMAYLDLLASTSSSTESDTTTKYQEVVRELEDLKNKFEDSEIQSSHTNEQLKIDVQSLMRSLEDEKLKVKELEQSLEEERRQRDEAFLRNAQMSQQIQIAQCDLRNTQQENDDLLAQLSQIELASKSKTSDVEKLKEELNELRSQVNGTKLSDLETELSEKNKTIRMLQQRLSDMKKTLQQELRNHTSDPRSSPNETRNNTSDPRSSPNESRNNTSGEDTPPVQPMSSRSNSLEDDVNFKYLKHVIIKFLTCREYEAQHLTRAVAVLLRLSAEEEQQLRDTLDMRNSWWPSRSRILPR
ncbi:hypothetical protein M8J76_010992 [Diaphorina citri]|nr:hypothetical protein M8J76_010992 [Diaphorina citri]